MIVLTKDNSSETFVVTLNEKRTLAAGYYLFVFTNFTTKEVINKIYNFTEDDSSYQSRYNEFDMPTQALFGGASEGQWIYQVYEQSSATNTDVAGLNMVEQGVMVLNPATEFERETYNEPTTFTQYGG